MTFEVYKYSLNEIVEVTDYVANGSFASLKENVNYFYGDGYAVLVRLVDHNSNWKGEKVFVDKKAYSFLSKSSLVTGDVVVANVGANAGTVFRVPDLGRLTTLGPNAVRVRPRESHLGCLSRDYLYYYLISPVGQGALQSIITGSAQPKFNKTALRGLSLVLPPIGQQNAIAALMRGVDSRITLLLETNATLEAIAQALFKSWFVDFDPVRAKAEGLEPEGIDAATAALFPDSFEESTLVPRGWVLSTLDDISDVGIGKTPPRKEAHWFSENPDDVRWVSIRDMGNSGAFLTETSEYLTADAISRFNVRRIPDNTVLLSFKMTIGRVAITSGEMTTNEAIAHCKINKQSPLSSEYIYLYLRQFDYSTLSSTSSIADAVNSKTVKTIPIIVPDADVAAAFQRAVSVIFDRIKTVQQQAKTLTQLRDTLLPRLISGQMRLPEAEVIVEEVCA